jgi:hypothetical protein
MYEGHGVEEKEHIRGTEPHCYDVLLLLVGNPVRIVVSAESSKSTTQTSMQWR